LISLPISAKWGVIFFGLLFVLGMLLLDIWLIIFAIASLLINVHGYEKEQESKYKVNHIRDQLKRAIILTEKNEYEEALSIFNSIIKNPLLKNEGKPIVFSLMARCNFNLENYKLAHSNILATMTHPLYKSELDDYIIKMLCEVKLGKEEEARNTFLLALETFPNDFSLKKTNSESPCENIGDRETYTIKSSMEQSGNTGKDVVDLSPSTSLDEAYCAVCGKKIFKPFYCKGCGKFLCGKHYLRGEHECVTLGK